jgi:hypothetical protein
MIKEIIHRYGTFSDSWISEIKYDKNFYHNKEIKNLEIVITCANKQNDFNYEVIKLIFKDVLYFVFLEENNSENFAPKDILIKMEDDLVLFDFLPIDNFDYLEEDPKSNFKIKCREVDYKFIRCNI